MSERKPIRRFLQQRGTRWIVGAIVFVVVVIIGADVVGRIAAKRFRREVAGTMQEAASLAQKVPQIVERRIVRLAEPQKYDACQDCIRPADPTVRRRLFPWRRR